MVRWVRKMVFENHLLKLLFLKCSLIILVVLGVGISQYFAAWPFSTYAKQDDHKVTICHIPQGNKENMQTIIVDENSVNYIAHLFHGDYTWECILPPDIVCGNWILETGEQCDDNNLVNNDGCDQYCEIENPPEPICWNEILEWDEQCDLGAENGQNKWCSLICTFEDILPVCGDGKIEWNEQCDDSGNINGDGCSEHCLIEILNPVCGNNLLEAGEECEDGNIVDRDGCSSACSLEIPIVTLVSTPPYGNLPLTATITSTKEPWSNYLVFDYGDGTPVINNPIFPLIHVYPNVGDYTVWVTAKSNFTGQRAPWYALPQVRAETLEQVTVTRCGDNIMEKWEQCEFMTWTLHTWCTDLCKRVVPTPSCYLALNETLVIFDHPVDFTFSNLTERESPYLLDFDDGTILTSELSNGLMTYTHSYNINNYTFNDFVPTIYVMNNIAAAAGWLILGSCSQALASIG